MHPFIYSLCGCFFLVNIALGFVYTLPKQSFDVNSLVNPITQWVRVTIWSCLQIVLKWPTAQLEQEPR